MCLVNKVWIQNKIILICHCFLRLTASLVLVFCTLLLKKGEQTVAISFKTAPIDSPISKKLLKSPNIAKISVERCSPEKSKLQGKIGNLDGEVIEQAIDKIKNEIAQAREETKKKEMLLRAISSDTNINQGRSSMQNRIFIQNNFICKQKP